MASLTPLQSKALPAPQSQRQPELQAALAAARHRNYSEAIKHLKREIAQDSLSTEAYLLIAEYAHYARDIDKEIIYFQKASEGSPRTANLYLALAALHDYAENWEGVFESSKRSLQAGGTAQEALEFLVAAALELQKTNQLAKALQELRKRPLQKHLYRLGYTRWRIQIGNYARAQKTLEDYLQEHPDDSFGHELAGDLALQRERPALSTDRYQKAMRLAGSVSRRSKLALLIKLGSNYFAADMPDSAEFYLSRGEEMATQSGSLQSLLDILNLRRLHYRRLGAFQRMAGACIQGLDILSFLAQESDRVPEFCYDAGWANEQMRDFETARRFYDLAVSSASDDEHSAILAKVDFGIGRLYSWSAETDSAMKYLESGLTRAEKSGRTDLSYAIRLKMADILRDLGKRDEAKKVYQKVLRYGQRSQQHEVTEICFVKLANLYLQPPAEFASADYYLAMADALARQTLQLRFAANHRWMQGNISLRQDDVEKAETYYKHAIQLGKETGSYLSILAGQAGLIRTYLRAGFIMSASSYADSALAHLTEYCTYCTDEYTSEFFDLKADLFSPAIAAYSQTGDLKKIYRACEQYKALRHTLAISGVKHRLVGAKVDSVHLEMENTQRAIRRKWKQLWQPSQHDAGDEPERIAQTKMTINQLHKRQRDLLHKLAGTQPAMFQIFEPYKLSLEALQRELVRLQSTFIHYFVGEDATFILAVRPDTVFCKRVNVNRTYLNEFVRSINPMFSEVDEQFTTTEYPYQFHLGYLAGLYNLLFEPIRDLLAPGSTLIIARDGFLNRLPFEALVANPDDLIDDHDYKNAHFLVEDYALVYLPFAGFLDFKLKGKTAATKRLAIFYADPASGIANGTHPEEDNSEIAALTAIADALGEGRSAIRFQSNAPKNDFLEACADYQILHLAVPGHLVDGAPLYSELLFTDKKSLKAYELFKMRLSADVAVLSNCDRKLRTGDQVSGAEGFLTGFNFAGVPMVVTTLWSLQQEKLAPILAEFYSNLRQGMNGAQALRLAKMTHLAEADRNPFFWAGSILNGSYEPVEFKSSSTHAILAFTILAIAVLIALLVRQIKRMTKQEQTGSPGH